MNRTLRLSPSPIDLRTLFGDRLRLRWEAHGETRRAWATNQRAWLLEILCRYGVIYPFGTDVLAAFSDHPRVGVRLRRLPFILSAHGDVEVVITFHIDHTEAVFAVLRPYRRRRLSPVQRAKNAATLAKARQERLHPLTQSNFRARGALLEARDDLPDAQVPENAFDAVEVALSQETEAQQPDAAPERSLPPARVRKS